MNRVKTEFPDFDDLDSFEKILNALDHYGFEDVLDRNEGMPCLEAVSEFMYLSPVTLVVWVDFKDPQKSDAMNERIDGTIKQFAFEERDVDGETDNERYFDTADELIAHARQVMDGFDEKSYLEMSEAEAEAEKKLSNLGEQESSD